MLKRLLNPTRNKLTKVGATFMGVGATAEFAAPDIMEGLPPDWIGVLLLLDRIAIVIGAITYLIGQFKKVEEK